MAEKPLVLNPEELIDQYPGAKELDGYEIQ